PGHAELWPPTSCRFSQKLQPVSRTEFVSARVQERIPFCPTLKTKVPREGKLCTITLPAPTSAWSTARSLEKGEGVSYCLGIKTRFGLIMASDSRTNAGLDQVNVCRKMHTFVREGDRVFVILTSGSLSLTQSVVTLLRRDFEQGHGLGSADS